MQVKDILDYFGPRLECRTKFHRVGETKILFETEGFDIMEDEEFLESFIINIAIGFDEKGAFLDLTLKK